MRSSESTRRWPRSTGALFVLATCVGLACGGTKSRGETGKAKSDQAVAPKPTRAEFKLFAFGRVLGTIAPCGCTTEPLGGVQYALGYIAAESKPQARLVLEPGSFLYPDPEGPEWPSDEAAWIQAHDRASLLQQQFTGLGETLVSGIGPTDVASPKQAAVLQELPLPRVAANVTVPVESKLPAHRIETLSSNGVKWTVGVTAVVDPSLGTAKNLGEVQPAAAALSKAVKTMKEAGADLTVAMAHGDRAFAESLAREVEGLDLVVVGIVDGVDRERLGTAPTVLDKPSGKTYVLEPGAQLQTMTELTLSLDLDKHEDVPSLDQWTVVPPRSAVQEELQRVEERLAKFAADPDADKAFLARLEGERDRLRERLEGGLPEAEVVATFEQVKVTCKRPVDEQARAALTAYDAKVAAHNKQRFAGVEPPEPAEGQPGFAGIEACGDCHDEAVEFWENTVHARAYQTLVDDNKQFDLSCVGCHVTGFRQPGGSEVVENAGLVDVQCESCHGPGSMHVDDGGEDLDLIELEAPAQLCATQCHTPEHSDTFEYEAYLRDILGPGHGEAKRKLLGDGPTGHELRQAGLKKAGGACKKM